MAGGESGEHKVPDIIEEHILSESDGAAGQEEGDAMEAASVPRLGDSFGKRVEDLLKTRSGAFVGVGLNLIREVEVFELKDHALLHQLSNKLSFHSNALLNLRNRVRKVDSTLAGLCVEDPEDQREMFVADLKVEDDNVKDDFESLTILLGGLYEFLDEINHTYALVVDVFNFIYALSRNSFVESDDRIAIGEINDLSDFESFQGGINLDCLSGLRNLYRSFSELKGWVDVSEEKLQGVVDQFVMILRVFNGVLSGKAKFLGESLVQMELTYGSIIEKQSEGDTEVLHALQSIFADDFEFLRREFIRYGELFGEVNDVIKGFSKFQDSSGLDSNVDNIGASWFAVCEVLRELCEMSVRQGIELKFVDSDLVAQRAFVYFNRGEFKRMIDLLVVNGIQSIDRGRFEEGAVSIFPYIADGKFCIEVKDNGEGVSKEDLAKVNAGEDGFTTTGGGYGLRDVRNLLGRLGGSIDFYSEGIRAKGAIVTVMIPLEGNDLMLVRDKA